MKTILTSGDPMGSAIYDYYMTGKAGKLVVRSSMFDDDEIPVPSLFREYDQMPQIEQIALQEACGSILDVGAGSGCHSLANMVGPSAINNPSISLESYPTNIVKSAFYCGFHGILGYTVLLPLSPQKEVARLPFVV